MRLTEQQIAMIEETMPYVTYVLKRRIQFIPSNLRGEAYSVACEALCRSAILYDGVTASFKTYAVRSMQNAVIRFLEKENNYNKHLRRECDILSAISRDEDDGSCGILDTILEKEALKEIYHSDVIDPEMQYAFLLAADGYEFREIAEELKLPLTSLKNRMAKARQKLKESDDWRFLCGKPKRAFPRKVQA